MGHGSSAARTKTCRPRSERSSISSPRLREGDYFGETALIDGGPRSATVTAASDLVCYGLTFWDFRPVVEQNGVIGWKLLQSMAKMYRDARQR